MNSKVQKISNSSFKYSSIEKISIPSNCTQICEFSFQGCLHLRNIEIQKDSKLQFIGESAFSETAIESISIPSNATLAPFWCAQTSKLNKINLIPRNEKKFRIL